MTSLESVNQREQIAGGGRSLAREMRLIASFFCSLSNFAEAPDAWSIQILPRNFPKRP